MDNDSSSSRSPRTDGADTESPLRQTLRGWLRGLRRLRNGEPSLRESLEELIEEHDESQEPINPEERLMLLNVLELDQRRVDDVMVPRADIVAADDGVSLEELVSIFTTASHSRLPVFRETLDDVIGMVHIKDLLGLWDKSQALAIGEIVREVLFVPPSMPVLDLLLQMQATRVHMAVVVDEFGGTDGLATIEDLVEEIVGEIEDEHDRMEAPRITELPDGTLEVDARTPIEDLEQRIGCDLLPEERDEDVETLGGVVFSLLGRVPRRGELLAHPSGIEFEVVDADARRVKRVRVRRPAPAVDSAT
jgi:CBS domain containing-hemolysin-like protein